MTNFSVSYYCNDYDDNLATTTTTTTTLNADISITSLAKVAYSSY